jgi:hypothetical protein
MVAKCSWEVHRGAVGTPGVGYRSGTIRSLFSAQA